MDKTSNILIFDDDCIFCNQAVKFILENDRSKSIYFTGSSSNKAIDLINKYQLKGVPNETIILISNNKVYLFSDAVLKTAQLMKGLFPLLILTKIIPLFIRNFIYKAIAKRRKRLLKNNCDISKEYSNHPRIIT
ncbi:MAG: thiol-disulfide oxidoreductase [Flavobacteriales bacterium]|nr:thiol-disulfide oxidoreductase [Flavobacteriales bacterium]